MTKQTVYLNNFARKSVFRLQFLWQSHHCWRDLMTSPIYSAAANAASQLTALQLAKQINQSTESTDGGRS